MKNLYNLRVFFIIYFLIKIVIDITLGSQITGAVGLNILPSVFYTAAIIINLVLFLLGLLIFKFLLEKNNWARILLLVIGWLAILDFFSSFFVSSKIAEISNDIAPLYDWESLILFDRITDFIGLIFWCYCILVLQFNKEIKKIYQPGN